MNGIYVPVVGSICLTLVYIVFSYLNSRNLVEVQRTIRAMLEGGTAVTPELIEKINMKRSQGSADFRRGVIITFTGFAAIAAGLISGATTEFATVAVFPIFLGLGFLVVWKMNKAD